jgi:hypothetical protein
MFYFCSVIYQTAESTAFFDQPGSTTMDVTALFRDLTALTAMAFAGYAVMLVS